jgi:predicted Mrr-cat superfamily restriction endonuclease
MRIWRIIPGEEEVKDYLLRRFIREEYIAIGWNKVGDLTNVDEKNFSDLFRKYYPGGRSEYLKNFRYNMNIGDIVFTVAKSKIDVIGKVISNYYYVEEEPYYHRRDVKWYKKFDPPIDLSELPDDIYRRLTSPPTVRETLIELNMEEWKNLVSILWLIS